MRRSPFILASLAALLSLSPLAAAQDMPFSETEQTLPVTPTQAPIPYRSFNKLSLTLYPYEGRNVVILAPLPKYNEGVMTDILVAADAAYDYYVATTGMIPPRLYQYKGKLSIAVVPATCPNSTASCGYPGHTGIELQQATFDALFEGVKQRQQYDQALFYELGQNFFFYTAQLRYSLPDSQTSIPQGFAAFMRYKSMEAAEVRGASWLQPTGQYQSFNDFKQSVRDLVTIYEADPSYTWSNTLKVGASIKNPLQLGSPDLFASFLLKLSEKYGAAFTENLWRYASQMPKAKTTQAAVDNFVIAASMAAETNLSPLFTQTWRWPLTESAKRKIEQLFPLPAENAPETKTAP